MVWCVVLNWNGWRDTRACLEALAAQSEPLAVAVVDNASTDGSDREIEAWIARHRDAGMEGGAGVNREASSVRFELLRAGRNGGFAAGNNVGIRRALTDAATEFVWLLNNDTVAPADTLATLLEAANANPAAGLVGSVLVYPAAVSPQSAAPERVQAWGGGRLRPSIAFASHFTTPQPPSTWADPLTYVTFASVLLRRAAIDAAGMLDEGYFMYYEDADLNLRMRRAGWSVAVAAQTRIIHREGGSREQRRSAWSEATTTKSAMRFIGTHGKAPWLGRVGFLLLRCGKRLLRGDVRACWTVLRAAFSQG